MKWITRDPPAARGDRPRRGHGAARPRPQCAGLLAISLGLSHNFPDDHEMLCHSFDVYDALFAWLSYRRDETHTWNPQKGT